MIHQIHCDVNSVYQTSGGCFSDSVFNLPDVFKAFVQTSQLISNCGPNPSAKVIAPYNTNAVGYVSCPNSAIISFAGNFDGACVNINTPPVGTPVEHNKCYSTTRSSGSSPFIGTNPNLVLPPGTISSLSTTFSLQGSTNCRNTCLKIYPRCARPTGQPSMQPSRQPSSKYLQIMNSFYLYNLISMCISLQVNHPINRPNSYRQHLR